MNEEKTKKAVWKISLSLLLWDKAPEIFLQTVINFIK